MLGAAGIGLGSLERAQASLRLGVADGARPAQGAQRRTPAGRRQAHDDGAELRDRSHLHGAGCAQRGRHDGARSQAHDDRVRALRSARGEQRERDREDGAAPEEVSESVHGGSVGEVCVTAQARGVPDV